MSQTESLSVNELEEAFEVFNRVSVELDTTYRELESKVAALTEELGKARTAKLQELAEKERLAHRLSSLVSALPGGVIIVDSRGYIRDANPEAIQLLGRPLLDQRWSDILLRSSGKSELESPELLLSNGRRYSVCSRCLDDLGDQVILITDVSEIHQLQEQLSRKKRLTALGEMAARLAHQIRTPLSTTSLYLAQLGRSDLPAEKRKSVSAKVSQRLDHMGRLLDSMLSFVRGETLEKELIYLHQVLREFETQVSPLLVENGSTLSVPSVDDTLIIVGDKDELVGALGNLAMNALEVSNGPVALETWVGVLNSDWLQIRFRDNGPGIDESILERIFDPFFTSRAQGTGLGLAVVASTVSGHGGQIVARNTPGGGAEFLIDLPIASPTDLSSDANNSGEITHA